MALGKIPTGLISYEQTYAELNLPIENKLTHMRQNYIEYKYNSFKSANDEYCQSHRVVPKDNPILRVKETYIDSNRIVKYFTCAGFPTLITLDYSSEEQKIFSLKNQSGDQIIKITDDESQSLFYLGGQLYLKIQKRLHSNENVYEYISYPIDIKLHFGKRTRHITRSRLFEGKYKIIQNKDGHYNYRDSNNQLIAYKDFQNTVNIKNLPNIVNALLMDLPKTKFVTSGSQNKEFLKELRNAQGYLLSNSNLEYVKNLIKTYIDEAQKGNILDNR